jgi:hypothetical protein
MRDRRTSTWSSFGAALLVTTILMTIGLGRTPASAQPAKTDPADVSAANAKVISATAHYKKAELGAALADLAEAYHLDPRPDLLYAMAHIEIELGDCAGAVAHYRQYLTTNPSAKGREAAEQGKAACEKKLGMSGTTAPTSGEPKSKSAPDRIDDRKATKGTPIVEVVKRPFYKDTLGDALAGGAVAAGVTGGVLYLFALHDTNKSETAGSLQEHDDLVARGKDLRTYAVVAGAIGGALAIGAVVRWVVHGGGTETRPLEAVSLGVTPGPDGTGWGLAAVGRF